MAQVAAFVSGKGGTGKTTLTAACAGALARRGRRVLCIDLDVGLRSLDISLGMRDEASISFQDVIEGRCPLSMASAHPTLPGVRLLTAPVSTPPEDIDEAAFFSLLTNACFSYDWILLDAPAGLGACFRLAVRRATRVVVVAQVDPASERSAALTGELVRQLGPAWVRVVVNRVNPRLYRRLCTNVDDIMDAVGLPLLGLVPEHPDVLLASASGVPLSSLTQCPAADACYDIACRLDGEAVPLSLHGR